MIIKKTLKSAVSIIAALLIFMLSITFYADRSNASNTSRRYYVFNPSNSNYIRDYDIEPLPENINTRGVIGEDTREVDWSKSGVVKIMKKNHYLGTGFVVSDHVIATAAHVVMNQSLTEILLFDNEGNVTMHATPVEVHVPLNHFLLTRPESDDYDYALVTVKEDLSSYANFNIGVAMDSLENSDLPIKVTGFPDDKNNFTNHIMASSIGNVGKVLDCHIIHNVDTSGGNSGSPVYIEESRCNKTYNTVFAIHVGGSISYPGWNTAIKITTDIMQFYVNNGNLKY